MFEVLTSDFDRAADKFEKRIAERRPNCLFLGCLPL
jgi:hypothetical protein